MKDAKKIIFRWKKGGRDYERMIDRREMLVVFEGLVKGFSNDNEISEKLVSVIPILDEIKINVDFNATQEIPSIVYVIDGKVYVLKIIRYHKIVWAIFNKYCLE